ncbi:hypothetical protein LTR57_025533 [Friedmanniomyces endolithicus]|nr:hypothetical protein LTR57_025533 [Friedmanniomyces endolithicus]
MSLATRPPMATPPTSPHTGPISLGHAEHPTIQPTPPGASQFVAPPENPDCILSLKDGSMLAASSIGVAMILQERNLIPHSYNLPIYYVDEEPDVVHLLHAIYAGNVDASQGKIPPMPTLYELARLCLKTGRAYLCNPYVCQWVQRWILESENSLEAEVLEVAMLCGDRQTVANVCRAFVLGEVSNEGVHQTEILLAGLPDSVQIGVMRATVRQKLRGLLLLPIADHPSVTTAAEDAHHCETQAADLLSYIRAPRRVQLFPVPDDYNRICLMSLGERLGAMQDNCLAVSTCIQCGYVGHQWGKQIDEIARSMNALLRYLMKELQKHLVVEMRSAREAV